MTAGVSGSFTGYFEGDIGSGTGFTLTNGARIAEFVTNPGFSPIGFIGLVGSMSISTIGGIKINGVLYAVGGGGNEFNFAPPAFVNGSTITWELVRIA